MKRKDERVNAKTRDKKVAWELFTRLNGEITLYIMDGYYNLKAGADAEEIARYNIEYAASMIKRMSYALMEAIKSVGPPSTSTNNDKSSMMLDSVLMDYLHKDMYPLSIKLMKNDMGDDKMNPVDRVKEVYTFLSQITSQVCYKGYLFKKPPVEKVPEVEEPPKKEVVEKTTE